MVRSFCSKFYLALQLAAAQQWAIISRSPELAPGLVIMKMHVQNNMGSNIDPGAKIQWQWQ